MGIRFGCAKAVAAVSAWGLTNVFRRPAANFPGKIALYVDPQLIGDLRGRVRDGSIFVVGTNGKTTVTNLLADAFEAAGLTVTCNRTGANLDSGVATALLRSPGTDWGVFESDELWLAKSLPYLRSDYVVLLNLFRDQLDRVGEIDHIQESIAGALASSPSTVLVYNADDPLCQAIANRVDNACVPFGLESELGLAQNTVADASMCQQCDSMLEYDWRQYGQLGAYECPNCGFVRSNPEFSAANVVMGDGEASFDVHSGGVSGRLRVPFSGAYMVYNALATIVAGALAGLPIAAVQQAIDEFDPKNGRLQPYAIGGREVLLNLAKNPTGFNQNLKIVMEGEGPKAVAFYINDKVADGRDVSWLWDIDFQELAAADNLTVYAGGIRRNDMQVRLKYAGVDSKLVDGAEDFLAKVAVDAPDAKAYLIANYTALPSVKAELDRLQAAEPEDSSMVAPGQGGYAQKLVLSENEDKKNSDALRSLRSTPLAGGDASASSGQGACTESAEGESVAAGRSEGSMGASALAMDAEAASTGREFVIAHMFPKLLNLYGDGGNVTVLEQRARWHGLDARVVRVDHGESVDLSQVDIVFIGGGPDREQQMASANLLEMADDLRAYVEDDGVMLAICGGFQIIGNEWLLGDEVVPGLGLVDLATKRAPGGSHNRIVGNIALSSSLAKRPVVGYENHAGRTFLGAGCRPFGQVKGSHGKGNNDSDKADGVLYRNAVGTYLHGPLLAKNPEVADELIRRALERRARTAGIEPPALGKLDDSVENAANDYMSGRLGVR